jgi:hypothetical protein
MPTIVNKITIAQDQESVVVMLLEKWRTSVPHAAAGHWYLDDGSCGSRVNFVVNAPEDNFWFYYAGNLSIGATPTTFDYDTNKLGPALNTYVALFRVMRNTTSGKFSVEKGGPGTGILYRGGNTKLNKQKPVSWESEWGYGSYSCPRQWSSG